jgi:hypothetical protein
MDDRAQRLDEALALIEHQFSGKQKQLRNEEFIDKLIAKGKACVMCRKVGGRCSCECNCQGCWGKLRG